MSNSNPIQPMSNILSQVVEDLSYGKVFIQDDYVTINENLAFRNGSLNILGSRPSIGKTSFSISLARNLTIKQNIPVGFFTCGNNNSKLIVRRFIAQEARVNYNSIAYGAKNKNDVHKIKSTSEQIAEVPFFLNDQVLSLHQLTNLIKNMVNENSVKLIIVDDIDSLSDILDYSLMWEQQDSSEINDEYRIAVSDILDSLKATAEILNIPIILTMHIFRSPTGAWPKISSFKGLASLIKKKSDMIMLLHRERSKGDDDYVLDFYLLIEKTNHGRRGIIRGMYTIPYMRYELEDRLESCSYN